MIPEFCPHCGQRTDGDAAEVEGPGRPVTPADLTLLGLSLGALALAAVLILILFEEG